MEEIKKKSTRKEYGIENENSNPTDNPDIRYLMILMENGNNF